VAAMRRRPGRRREPVPRLSAEPAMHAAWLLMASVRAGRSRRWCRRARGDIARHRAAGNDPPGDGGHVRRGRAIWPEWFPRSPRRAGEAILKRARRPGIGCAGSILDHRGDACRRRAAQWFPRRLRYGTEPRPLPFLLLSENEGDAISEFPDWERGNRKRIGPRGARAWAARHRVAQTERTFGPFGLVLSTISRGEIVPEIVPERAALCIACARKGCFRFTLIQTMRNAFIVPVKTRP
jgi:hypothetical protein